MPFRNIKLTPRAAHSITESVNLVIFSLSRSQAKAAVINGIELQINKVAATVVVVIACKRQILAIARKDQAARRDDQLRR